MKKFVYPLIILAQFVLVPFFVMAQQSKTQLNTEVSTNFPDNTVGAITPAILRTTTNDIIASFQQAPQVSPQSGTSYTIQLIDYGKVIPFTNASPVAVTLPQATGSFQTFNFYVNNLSSSSVTVTPTTSTINGGSSFSVTAGNSAWIVSDGSNYRAISIASTSVSTLDVWISIGSSNNVGQGNSAQAPIPPSTALMYCYTGVVQALADPVCSSVDSSVAKNASSGSMWPAFAIAYNRPMGLIQTAVGGSTTATACDFLVGNGNWQDTSAGSNYAKAITAINAGLAAYTAAGYTPVIRGILSGDLGTNDAANIDASVCTINQFTAAWAAMAANFRSASLGGKVYPHLPIYMSLVGTNTDPTFPDSPGYYNVRAQQLSISAIDGNTLLPYVKLPSFANRGMIQTNSVHPFQIGYNEWGTALGGAVNPYIPGNVSYQVINANNASQPLPPAGTVLQLAGPDSIGTILLADSFGSNAPSVVLRSAGGTNAVPTALGNGANIGLFSVRGYGSTGYGTRNVGSIVWTTEQAWTDAAQGNKACIFTTPNGSNVPVCRLTIGQSGVVSAQTMSAQALSAITLSTQGLAVIANGNVAVGTTLVPDAPLTINANTANMIVAPGAGTNFHMIGANGGTVNNIFTYDGFNNDTATGVNLFIARQANGTPAAPLPLSAGNIAFSINTQGYNGSAYAGLATLDFLSINQTSGTDSSGQIRFRTVATGATNLVQRALIKQGLMLGNISTDPGIGAVTLSPQTFATLASCTTSLRGTLAAVSDSNTVTWGAVVAGLSSSAIIAHCNGTNWTVMGK